MTLAPSLCLLLAGVVGSFTPPAPWTGAGQDEQSKEPPPGAPWQRDFLAVHREAVEARKPIFVYSTKTYCPHCVKMEKDLLVDPLLARHYGDVVWMYLYQDFSGDERDRAAERVALRFGISSWPQHMLIDPYTLEVLADTGRSLETFGAAVRSAQRSISKKGPVTPEALAEADRLAASLEEERVRTRLLDQHVLHRDVVVRYRALAKLIERAPKRVSKMAGKLLATPHDQVRFAVCELLVEEPNPEVRGDLEALLARPTNSWNPNVLRMRCARALGAVGTGESLEVLAPFATSGEALNGLTGTAVDAVAAIARREGRARDRAVEILIDAFPRVPADLDPGFRRSYPALARRVHDALRDVTQRRVEFVPEYTDESRAELVERWRR